jgi:MYXO-CTERM domain-containing protein
MDNTDPVAGLQFTLAPPPGVTLMAGATNMTRAPSHSVNTGPGNPPVILMFTISTDVIAPGTGEIATLFFDVDPTAAPALWSFSISGVILADSVGQPLPSSGTAGEFEILGAGDDDDSVGDDDDDDSVGDDDDDSVGDDDDDSVGDDDDDDSVGDDDDDSVGDDDDDSVGDDDDSVGDDDDSVGDDDDDDSSGDDDDSVGDDDDSVGDDDDSVGDDDDSVDDDDDSVADDDDSSGDDDRSGCSCEAGSADTLPNAWALLPLLGLVGRRRRT